MSGLYIALTAMLGLACMCIIVAVLMQKKRDAGFSGAAAGMGATGGTSPERSHFDKAKRRTLEGKLERWTKILAVVFMGLSLIISLMA